MLGCGFERNCDGAAGAPTAAAQERHRRRVHLFRFAADEFCLLRDGAQIPGRRPVGSGCRLRLEAVEVEVAVLRENVAVFLSHYATALSVSVCVWSRL